MATPWTKVQNSTATTSTGTGTVAPAWPAPTTAGSNLVALLALNAGATAQTFVPPSGTQTNWTAGPHLEINSQISSAVFYISNSPARSGSETFGMSSSTRDMFALLIEYSHSNGMGFAVDQFKTNSGSSTAISSGTTPNATDSADGLVLTILSNVNTSTEASSAGTPTGTFSTVANAISANGVAASRIQGYVYEDLATAAGTAETHATLGTSRIWQGLICAFAAYEYRRAGMMAL